MKIDGNVDEVLSLLNDSRRRHALYCLLSNEYVDIDGLSLQIAAWERDETIASVDTDATEEVKVSLHHNHLPRLVESDVIEYDSRCGDIVRGDGFDEIESVVEQFRSNEDRGVIEDASDLATEGEDPEPFPSP